MRSTSWALGLVLTLALVAHPLHADPARPRARIEHDAASGRAQLVIAATDAAPARIVVSKLCRYDPTSRRWRRDGSTRDAKVIGASTRIAIGDEIGLYWIEWTEDDRAYQAQVASGPIRCNDIMIAPPQPPGTVRTCVPHERSASAEYVPDPALHCR